MNSTGVYSPMGGISNAGFSRENISILQQPQHSNNHPNGSNSGNLSSHVGNHLSNNHLHRSGLMNTTGETTVSAGLPDPDSDEQQEVIEVQILPQDEHWGENTTAVTINSDLDYNDQNQGGFIANGTGGNGPPELEKWRLETERGMGFRC